MKKFKNVLCAVDFSKYCRNAAERAAEIARFYGARLTLLHVVEHFGVNRSNVLISPEDIDPRYYHEQQAKKSLAELARSLDYDKVEQEVRFSTQAAKRAIVRYAGEKNTDLIVVATHGRHGITSILGSTSYGVTHMARCDVLVISAHHKN